MLQCGGLYLSQNICWNLIPAAILSESEVFGKWLSHSTSTVMIGVLIRDPKSWPSTPPYEDTMNTLWRMDPHTLKIQPPWSLTSQPPGLQQRNFCGLMNFVTAAQTEVGLRGTVNPNCRGTGRNFHLDYGDSGWWVDHLHLHNEMSTRKCCYSVVGGPSPSWWYVLLTFAFLNLPPSMPSLGKYQNATPVTLVSYRS